METKFQPLSADSQVYQSFLKFGTKTLQELKNIENELEEAKQETVPMVTMKNVQSLLNSYEIILLELCQCCEVMNLRVFGRALLKMFLQNMSIIKWILSLLTNNLSLEKGKRPRSNLEARSTREKGSSFSQEFYRTKEQNKFVAQFLESEIQNLETCDIEAEKQLEKMQTIVMKIQPSHTQEMIREATKVLNKKNQYLSDFLTMRNQNARSIFQDVKGFEIEEAPPKKIDDGIKRLKKTFAKFASKLQKNKKEQMSSKQCQVNIEVKTQQNRLDQRDIKQKQQIAKLSKQLSIQKAKSESLESLIKAKGTNFEKEMMGMRLEVQNFKRQRDEAKDKLSEHMVGCIEKEKMPQAKEETIQKKGNTDASLPSKSEEKKISSRQARFKKYRPLLEEEDEDSLDFKELTRSIKKRKFCIVSEAVSFIYHFEQRAQTERNNTLNQYREVDIKIEPGQFVQLGSLSRRNLKTELGIRAENYQLNKNMMRRPSISHRNSNFSDSDSIHIAPKLSFLNSQDQRKPSIFGKASTPKVYQRKSKEKSKQRIQKSRLSIQRFQSRDNILTKHQSKKPEKKLVFTEEDLRSLFLDDEKALAYEFTNYNLVLYRKTYEVNDLQRLSKYRGSIPKGKNSTKEDEKFIYLLTKQLANLKRMNEPSYGVIRNFLRFPYSFINKRYSSEWEKLSQEEEDLSIQEIRKIYFRLKKLHQGCPAEEKGICEHIDCFLERVKAK